MGAPSDEKIRAALEHMPDLIENQITATRHYLVQNNIDAHFADVLLSHYYDFAREIREALSSPPEPIGGEASDEPEVVVQARSHMDSLFEGREIVAAYEYGLTSADRFPAEAIKALEFYRDNWKFIAIGDEGDGVTDFGRLEGYEAEPDRNLKEDGGSIARAVLDNYAELAAKEAAQISLAFVCAGLPAADKRSVIERILALGSQIDAYTAGRRPSPSTPEGEAVRMAIAALAEELDALAMQAHSLEEPSGRALSEATTDHGKHVNGAVNGRIKGKRYAYSHAAQLVSAALTALRRSGEGV